jgi:hypothetical protein
MHKHYEALHHVEESLRHFIEREVVRLLEGSRAWGAARLRVGDVEAGTNRIMVELVCPDLGADALAVGFEEHAGWLLARLARPGWLPRLSARQAEALTAALAGLYKLSGVHLVHEQIVACLGPKETPYAVTDTELILWPGDECAGEAAYDLRDGAALPPHLTSGKALQPLPTLGADQLRFDRVPLTWQHWVETWQQDQAGQMPGKPFLGGIHLLPEGVGGRKP